MPRSSVPRTTASSSASAQPGHPAIERLVERIVIHHVHEPRCPGQQAGLRPARPGRDRPVAGRGPDLRRPSGSPGSGTGMLLDEGRGHKRHASEKSVRRNDQYPADRMIDSNLDDPPRSGAEDLSYPGREAHTSFWQDRRDRFLSSSIEAQRPHTSARSFRRSETKYAARPPTPAAIHANRHWPATR
jgi:hypothetical protein